MAGSPMARPALPLIGVTAQEQQTRQTLERQPQGPEQGQGQGQEQVRPSLALGLPLPSVQQDRQATQQSLLLGL